MYNRKVFKADDSFKMTLTKDTLNDTNRAGYGVLLTCENELDLTLVENQDWCDEDISFITNALKNRKSVVLNCDMVPHSEGYVAGYLNYQIIQELKGVKVTVYDTVNWWKAHEGSWRDSANIFYKNMSKHMNRKYELQSDGVIFHPVKAKESKLSWFAKKLSPRDENVPSLKNSI